MMVQFGFLRRNHYAVQGPSIHGSAIQIAGPQSKRPSTSSKANSSGPVKGVKTPGSHGVGKDTFNKGKA